MKSHIKRQKGKYALLPGCWKGKEPTATTLPIPFPELCSVWLPDSTRLFYTPFPNTSELQPGASEDSHPAGGLHLRSVKPCCGQSQLLKSMFWWVGSTNKAWVRDDAHSEKLATLQWRDCTCDAGLKSLPSVVSKGGNKPWSLFHLYQSRKPANTHLELNIYLNCSCF